MEVCWLDLSARKKKHFFLVRVATQPWNERHGSLDCLVGIDDEVAYSGKHIVALKITGDGNVLFEKNIATTDDPLPLQLPLSGVSTLTILVDFGDNESTCDWLNLADAKLLIAKDKQK